MSLWRRRRRGFAFETSSIVVFLARFVRTGDVRVSKGRARVIYYVLLL